MPFIDCRVSVRVTGENKEKQKAGFGRAATCLHKTESYLMVGFADGYDLYFGGEKQEKGAYVSVSLFGSASPADYERMTGEICALLARELGIPGKSVYVTYHGVADWGWNGSNF